MFIPKEGPPPTDPAVIDQLKTISHKIDKLHEDNDILAAKTRELDLRLRARCVVHMLLTSLGESSNDLMLKWLMRFGWIASIIRSLAWRMPRRRPYHWTLYRYIPRRRILRYLIFRAPRGRLSWWVVWILDQSFPHRLASVSADSPTLIFLLKKSIAQKLLISLKLWTSFPYSKL